MPFLIKDNELLEQCNNIWKNVSYSVKKRFDSKAVYDEKYLKIKIKFYEGEIKS